MAVPAFSTSLSPQSINPLTLSHIFVKTGCHTIVAEHRIICYEPPLILSDTRKQLQELNRTEAKIEILSYLEAFPTFDSSISRWVPVMRPHTGSNTSLISHTSVIEPVTSLMPAWSDLLKFPQQSS